MTCVEFTVNGQKCTVNNLLHRDTSLSAYIRYFLGLPGTKAMCRQGVCGACIVNVSARRHTTGEIETFSVNSCLVLVFSCHGWDITTVEAIGSRGLGYSEFQKRIAAFHGTQCGFCTPGWVMQMQSLLPKNLMMIELENSFGSNTCRCTGYRSIFDTIKSFAVDASPELCQQVDDIEELATCIKDRTRICNRKCSETNSEDDWTVLSADPEAVITVHFGDKIFFKVFREDQIFQLFNSYGVDNYLFIDGNTGRAVVHEIEYPAVVIDISAVSSLKQYHFDQNLVLGANISLEECLEIFKKTAATMDDFKYLEEFAKHLDLVAQIPVRNIGSLAGNLMLKHIKPSYRSDVFVLFEAVGATVTIRGAGNFLVSMSLPDFLKYDMRGKLILNFELPPQGPNHIIRSYKVMPRSQNALAIVNAAFNIKINPSTSVIEKATIVYGNISAAFIHATQTEKYLKGKNVFSNNVLQGAISRLNTELVPVDDPAEPTPAIRKKMAIGLFYKFILSIAPISILKPIYQSGGTPLTRPLSSGKQDFQTDSSLYPLNQPVQKLEAIIQSSGEARYVNDIPPLPKEVFGAFVLSTVHNGDVDVVDVEGALDIPDVIAVYTAKDIPGVNSFTFPGFQLQKEDEEVLADTNIKYYGQPVAIVVATSEELATSVARKVKVTYKNVTNVAPVLTINKAKLDKKRVISGDTMEPKGRGTNVRKVIKGVFEVGAQYHYYLEPLSCVTIPVDNGFEVHDVTQWMDLTQGAVSRFLNISESDVHVKVRRLGGGFGGKISRNVQVACASALVAKTLDRPCRFILPLDTNLTIAGRRLPCQCEYEVGVDNDGKIQYLNASLTEDDGFSHNENVLSYVVSSFANCYNTDYFSVKSFAVTTDLPSNTFARAPGTLEGIASIENIMEHIAVAVNKDPTDVRLANMVKEENDLPTLINTLKASAEYERRSQEIKLFNKNNRWRKKSIQISVMLFPVIYYGNYTAMVSIYRGDGSVTVTTGGIEMGQGVNTKAAQVCAYELGIPLEKVTIIPNYSFVAANNIFSGSSIVSESVCFSIIKACNTLKERLKPIKDQMINPTWEELIKKAGDELIDLTATYMMTDKEPELQGYNVFAVTILEVELDVLTGKFQISRADILEDVGLSANPKIDVGQVEGAYVQGLSYFTSEKLIFDKTTGQLLTSDALSYEVYLAKDIPVDFRVNLRYNSNNPKGVLGSKAVGEMGICSSHGIIYALRQCIRESRIDSGYDANQWFDMDLPLTTESILKALNVKNFEFILY
ncbi:xanthine dehydrogenase/oxidase-like [Vanessa cardui]|uniref:xanthine dehydrogenase/oxidase-like n=1 Tax=Vanessa cardui TaxID=171605 RepID=UPI001F131FA8|nr:xanthine dehydrogenase/oxidase-like [Vanessa cardui]